MDSMADRLKSLGFKKAVSIPSHAAKEKTSLEIAVDGRVIENSLGEFVLKETLYPLDHHHGVVAFESQVKTETINRTAKIRSISTPLEKLLFIDTETSGLSGGAGTFAFLVGLGRFTNEGFLLSQLIMRDPGEEPALLLHLLNQIDAEDIFVSFNGKSFDIPLLQNRLVMNRFTMKLRENQHLDMLHISRKLWRHSLESCALKDLENAILKFERTSEDVPGWMIPDIYFAYLRNGDPGGLKEVVYHNAQDIVSLAALFIHVTTLLDGDISPESIPIDDLIAISRIYWDLGSFDTSRKILQAALPRVHRSDHKMIINSSLGCYYKKIGCSHESVKYWQVAATEGDVVACIELAMYFEHTVKDIPTALGWCEKALRVGDGTKDKREQRDLQKRMYRLQQKWSNHV